MTATARAQAAAAVVRRLNGAVKSRRLYVSGHALRAQTVGAFVAAVVAYHERFGNFVLETHKDGLILEGKPFEGGESVDSLALLLYAVGVWQLVLLSGITEAEADQLLDVVILERDAILAEGGFVEVLARRGIEHVRVFELRPGEEDVTNISLETVQQLLDGSLQAQDRAAFLGLLRAGPEQAHRVLDVLVERTRQAFPNASGPELAARMYEALSALDRLIVDAPPAESRELLQRVATAVVDVEDSHLHATILQRAAEDLSARALLAAMTSEQIARMVIPCLEAGDPPPQVAQVVNGLPFDLEKARDTMALISQRTGRAFDLPPLREELRLPSWIRNVPQDLVDFTVSDSEVTVTDEEIQTLVGGMRVDDAALTREHALTLLHLSLAEDDPRDLDAILAALVQDTETLLQQSAYDSAGTVLRSLASLASHPGPKAGPVQAALRKLIAALAGVVTAKDVVEWAADHPLLSCLRQAGPGADLVHALHAERDPGRRQTIAAILARLGDDYVESLQPHLSNPDPEFARQIIHILAQMHTAKAVSALKAVARYPDAGIRKETVDALGVGPSAEEQSTLLAFLHDPDPLIREHVLQHLRPETARRTVSELAAMLLARDLQRYTGHRIRIVEMLVQVRAKETLPLLRRLASPFKIRKRDRELARHARAAVAMLSAADSSSVHRRAAS